MKVVVFTHSLVSDQGDGNVHFLRGVVTELQERGHEVTVLESADSWRRANPVREDDDRPLRDFARAFPHLSTHEYEPETLALEAELDDADLVLVQAWNDPSLAQRIGKHRARHGGYQLLFHDSHHRACTAPEEISHYDLSDYDGVLAGGEVIRQIYLENDWVKRAWTWHEAADVRVFYPLEGIWPEADLAWIGSWGDGERGDELRNFLLRPARQLRLRGTAYGVDYPWMTRLQIRLAGLRYRGWVANHRLPQVFARHRLTVHIPRRSGALAGIPGARPFEALACGIPLVSSPWDDCEGLLRPGQDYLIARDCAEMREAMQAILEFPEFATKLRVSGLETIRARHTCAHRVDELLAIDAELRGAALDQHGAPSL